LDTAFPVFIQELGSISFWGELGVNTIGDWKALVRGEAWFDRMGMLEFSERVFNVPWHTDATATIRIVPFDVDTSKLVPCHVELYSMKFLENIKEVIEVFYSNIFYSKVINNEAELDGTPFVAPEARGGFHLVVTFNKKARSEEIIGKDASLGQTITTLANFVVDPTIAVRTCKLVFFHKFSGDIRDFDADVLRVGHWGIEVEVLEVEGAEARAFAEEFKGSGVGTNISWVTDAIATNGDVGAIRIIFIRTHFTNYHGVTDFLSFVEWDVMIINEKECVSACNSFGVGGGS